MFGFNLWPILDRSMRSYPQCMTETDAVEETKQSFILRDDILSWV